MSLSPVTILNYESSISRLYKNGFDDETIVTNQKETLEWIILNSSPTNAPSTINVFVSAVRWYIKKSYGIDDSLYAEYQKKIRAKAIEKQNSQTLSATKMDNFVEWEDILALQPKARAELSKVDYLFYSLYTLTPPVREDYSNMFIKSVNSKSLSKDCNYLIRNKDKSKWKFVFNVYKTSKAYGQVVLNVPLPLVEVITEFINYNNLTNGSRMVGNTISTVTNSVTHRIAHIFSHLTGKTVGISMLRHSFIKHFLSQKRSIKEKEIISKHMLHSYIMQEKYDIISDEE